MAKQPNRRTCSAEFLESVEVSVRHKCTRTSLLSVIAVFAFTILKASAQTDYPFRNPELSDDVRIADLLHRLTLQEKVELMDGHPKIPRLHLMFSDEAEGLHGLALGGPGNWGSRGRSPLPTTIFPQEKGLGETWDPAMMKKIGHSKAKKRGTTIRTRFSTSGGSMSAFVASTIQSLFVWALSKAVLVPQWPPITPGTERP